MYQNIKQILFLIVFAVFAFIPFVLIAYMMMWQCIACYFFIELPKKIAGIDKDSLQ